jgi:WD40 repeat protein
MCAGKTLAVGYDNGSISLYSAENGDILATTHDHQDKIVCLHWTQMASSGKVKNEPVKGGEGKEGR